MVNSNINNFKQYVKINVDELKERGESTEDLMINLLKDDQVASDAKFVRHIKASEYQCANGDEMPTFQLMRLYLNDYNISTKSDKCNSMYLEEYQFFAFTILKKTEVLQP